MPAVTAKEHAQRVAFGRRVRELRVAANLSQEECAHLAGLDRTYVGGIERGERNVSLDNIYRLARALKIGVPDLFLEQS